MYPCLILSSLSTSLDQCTNSMPCIPASPSPSPRVLINARTQGHVFLPHPLLPLHQDSCFEDNPGVLMYGMMCVLYTTGMWLILASYLELPVSTTHSTIGSIVGMVVAYGGADCVVWKEDTDSFPYVEGMVAIVASWVISPVFSGIVSFLLFLTVRTFILRQPRAFERSFYVYPMLVMFTIAVNGKL